MTYTITTNLTVQASSSIADLVNLVAVKDLMINVAKLASYSFSFNANQVVDLSHLQINKASLIVVKSTKPVDVSVAKDASSNDIYTGVFGTLFLRAFVGTSATITQLKIKGSTEAGSFELFVGIPAL